MIDFIYQTLTKFGYTHPLHPTLTHVPIGMVIGAFVFALVALIFHRTNFAQTARHCAIFALIAAVPTAILGILDWQHFFSGAMLFPIKMKLVLAGILIIFLILAVIFGFFSETLSKNNKSIIIELNPNRARKIIVPGAFFFWALLAVCIHSMELEVILTPPGLRPLKEPLLVIPAEYAYSNQPISIPAFQP